MPPILGQTTTLPPDAIDPRRSEQDAVAFVDKFLTWMTGTEINLIRWYEALVGQMALGVVNCQEILRYNQLAQSIYYWQADFFDKGADLLDYLRSQGIGIPDEPPLPRLIGTSYNTWSTGKGRQFQVSVPCNPDGTARVSEIKVRPLPDVLCTPPPDLQGLGAPQGLVALCASWPGVVGCAIVTGMIAIGGYYSTAGLREIRRTLQTFTGADIVDYNRAMAETEAKRDAELAENALKCLQEYVAKAPKPITHEQLVEAQRRCYELAGEVTKKRPKFGSQGLAVLGAMGLVGGVALVAYLVTRPRKEPRSDRRAADRRRPWYGRG